MTGLNVDVGEVERVARELSEYARDIGDMQRNLKNIGDDVESTWISEFTPSYIDSLGVSERKLGNLSGDVERLASRLRSIAAEIRRLEEELRRKMAEAENSNG